MAAILTFVASFGLALLLLGGVETEQLVASAAFAVTAMLVSMMIRRIAERPIRFSPNHFAPWLRTLARMPWDTVKVGGVLMKAAVIGGSPGNARRSAFRSGTRDDPAERGRRATALLAGSLTPEAIIVNAAPRDDAAWVHVMSGDGPSNPEWLT